MPPEIIGSIAGAGLSTLGSLLGASYSQDYNRENIGLQAAAAKGLADYQWRNFSSPAAQISALNKVGLGVNAFVGGKGQAAQPSMPMPSSAPVSVDGIADLGAISSYILSVAQAKKAGMDTNLAEQEIKNKQVQQQADEFRLSLARKYGNDEMASKVANSYMQLVLASDQSDLNEIEKNIKRFEETTSQYVSQIKESERDMARQELENNPTLIRLKNRLVKNQGTAAAAAAEASQASARESSAQAEQTELFNKIYSDQRFKHSIITQAVEGGRNAVEQRKLTKSQAEHMNYMVQQAAYATDMQEFTYWSNQIQGFVHSIGEGVSSFYGAGALRELIKVRQNQGKPSLESGKGYYLDNDGLLFKRP